MADATTPVLLHPRSTLSTKLTEFAQKDFMARRRPKMNKISDDLTTAMVNDVETYTDEDATVDTAATSADFFVELLAEIVTAVKMATLKPLGLDVDWVPYKIGDYYVFTGTIATATLQRFETLTADDSAATLSLAFGAVLTVGAARVIVCRLLTGTISAADAVLTGGTSTGTLTMTAGAVNQAGGANNRCPGIGGRLKVGSTGLAHASQTSIAVSYVVEGTKV